MPKPETAAPFTWTVRFTVAPLWVQDGFIVSDTDAVEMMHVWLPQAREGEISAKVLHAPSALHIARMQGYGPHSCGVKSVVKALAARTPDAGVLHRALVAAETLLDSVAFVSQPGDTDLPLKYLREALAAIATRQGEPVEIET